MEWEVVNIGLLSKMKNIKNTSFFFFLVFILSILFIGCTNNESQNNTLRESSDLTLSEFHNRPFNDSFVNRSRFWNTRNISRNMMNITRVTGGRYHRFNMINISDDRFLDIKKRLGLPNNASEEEVREALQNMRRQNF